MRLRHRIIPGLGILALLLLASCGGGGSSGGSGGGEASPDVSEGLPITSVSFDLAGAVGLAIDDTPSGSSASLAEGDVASSNLKRVDADNSLSDAVTSGSVKVRSFMIAANNQVYLLLQDPVESCILVRVDGSTNEATCVDSTLAEIKWANSFGAPIQFDGEGNVYYQGAAEGRTVLRRKASGETTDLVNDYISLKGFLVLSDGKVMISGKTSSTDTKWTRIVLQSGALRSFLTFVPNFLTLFPDNNVYIEDAQGFAVARYLTATDEFDSIGWIGSPETSYYSSSSFGFSYYPSPPFNDRILRTTDGKVYVEDGHLLELYPVVSKANTSVSQVTISKGILTYILLAGFDSANNNKLVIYDTDTDTETDLVGSEDIEGYHLAYLNSADHQIVMFDGLRFSDNRYVLCQVDLTDNNALTCSDTGTGKLTDLQLFDDANTIAGGGTNDTKTYTIGGVVTGLYGEIVLGNLVNGDSVTLTKNGPFKFPIAVASDYELTVMAQPEGQTCTVSEGSGSVSDSHITTVSVVCSTDAGVIVTLTDGLNMPSGLAFAPSGDLFFSDYSRIRKMAPDGAISPVAGTGSTGFSGDGGAAADAKLNWPVGIAIDPLGNIYFADSYNHRIRKVDTNGIITTVAGTGVEGFSGDGGPAVNAKFKYPKHIAIDDSGNLYIADSSNCRVRRIDTSGIIATVAGNGTCGFSFSGDGVLAIATGVSYPAGLTIDALGNLYISDTLNHRVRKVSGESGVITTVAGNGTSGSDGDGGSALSAQLDSPQGLTFDDAGNLYISDTDNHLIRKVATNGIITTIAGNGIAGFYGDGDNATSAALNRPDGIVVDSSGNIVFADSNNNRIRMVGRE